MSFEKIQRKNLQICHFTVAKVLLDLSGHDLIQICIIETNQPFISMIGALRSIAQTIYYEIRHNQNCMVHKFKFKCLLICSGT